MVRQRRAGRAYDRGVTRVLLVEDDRDIAEPLARALGREGYEVSTLGDGRAAVRTVLDAPPDLIILDVGLPGMDGLEVCRHVRDVRPQVPILMLTARDGELETIAGLDAGADDYVTKPFRLAVLLARVRATLRRSGPGYRLRVTELTDATMLTSSGTTKRLDKLEREGLIRREPDPADRRGTLIALTQAGRELIDGVTAAHLANEKQLISALSKDEQRALADLLRKLGLGLPGG